MRVGDKAKLKIKEFGIGCPIGSIVKITRVARNHIGFIFKGKIFYVADFELEVVTERVEFT